MHLIRWFKLQLHHASATMSKLWQTPFTTGLTILVLGVALSLPTELYILTKTGFAVGGNIDSGNQIQAFIKKGTPEAKVSRLKHQLEIRHDVSRVNFLTEAAAFSEFKAHSGFGDALAYLGENPFPALLTIYPKSNSAEPAKLDSLQHFIGKQEIVDLAEYDQEWVKKLTNILVLLNRLITILAVLLGVAVLLIVGNTIRLYIQNEKRNIFIYHLFGATSNYIRRPFLYLGAWYGFWGGVVAFGIVALANLFLRGPINELAKLYNAPLFLQGMDLSGTLFLLLAGIAFGWFGAWLAVSRYIHKLQTA